MNTANEPTFIVGVADACIPFPPVNINVGVDV